MLQKWAARLFWPTSALGVDRYDLAGDQLIEQVADGCEPLLGARRCEVARPGLDSGGEVHRLNSRDRRHASSGAPGQEFSTA
jgi:hypothetical protein